MKPKLIMGAMILLLLTSTIGSLFNATPVQASDGTVTDVYVSDTDDLWWSGADADDIDGSGYIVPPGDAVWNPAVLCWVSPFWDTMLSPEALRDKLDRVRARSIEELNTLDIRAFVKPRGGFYLWCELPNGQDAAAMARKALKKGVVLAPGNVFSPTQSKNSFLRFNVSQMAGKTLSQVLRDLMSDAQ